MDYRHHLRAVVAASAAPYGYTLTLWTAGAVTTHAEGLPSALDALLLLAGAVTGFAGVAAFAYGGINGVFAPRTRGEIRGLGRPPSAVGGVKHLAGVGRDSGCARVSRLAARRVHRHIDIPARHRPAVLAGYPPRSHAGAPELRRSG